MSTLKERRQAISSLLQTKAEEELKIKNHLTSISSEVQMLIGKLQLLNELISEDDNKPKQTT